MSKFPLQELAGRLSSWLGGGRLGFAFRSLYWHLVGLRFWPSETPPPGMGLVGIPWSGTLTPELEKYGQELARELGLERAA